MYQTTALPIFSILDGNLSPHVVWHNSASWHKLINCDEYISCLHIILCSTCAHCMSSNFAISHAVAAWSSFIELVLVMVLLLLLVHRMVSLEFSQWWHGRWAYEIILIYTSLLNINITILCDMFVPFSLCEGTLEVIKDRSLVWCPSWLLLAR